jgi:hydroxyethylthiazole kinase-like uncharacterized protein yjeF
MPHFTDPLPIALHTAAQVRDLDARLIAAGTPGFELMRRAAAACWQALLARWPDVGEVTVLTGGGNNGGDGYLVALLAREAGWQVQVLELADRLPTGNALLAREQAQRAGVPVQPWSPEALLRGVLVDALLGTGLTSAPREPFAGAIRAINASGLPVLAVDIPSGLSSDSGHAAGEAVRVDLTVTFIALKLGLFTGRGPDLVGELLLDELGADPALLAATPVVARRLAGDQLQPLAPRPRSAHKGRFGRLLIVGGERGTSGAVLLAADAALRSGAGLISVATRPETALACVARTPEVMARGLESANQLLPLVEASEVLLVGPGLGQGAWARSLLSVAAAQAGKRQLWDADALNLLAAGAVQLPAGSVITPHPGEAARLLDCTVSEVEADRPAAALKLAERYAACVVLKGAGSLIASPDGQLALCDHGHPAMAGAGFGDVLGGLIAALLAQGMQPYAAACLGVWLHARAGERLGLLGRGMAASDLLPVIRELLEEHSPCLS